MRLHHDVAKVALAEGYAEIDRLIGGLDETDLMRPSGCAGWTVGDVLFHLLTGIQDVLLSLSGPTKDPATVDYVSYWRNHATVRSDEADLQSARYVRLGAAAYPRPAALVAHWQRTCAGVLKVVDYAPGERKVPFDGRVITITDLFAAAAVEATIHHLDMLAHLPGQPEPRPSSVDLTARVLEALMGGHDRPDWDDHTFIVKVTGRLPLTIPERRLFEGYRISLPLVS